MHRLKGIVVILVWLLTINTCPADDKWVADEIFLQLSSMRKEIQQLQEKMALLEKKLPDGQPRLAAIPIVGAEKMTLGKQDAAIAILAFSDYECPYCGKHYKNVLIKLRESYIDTGKVKYVMKDFPLEFHAFAKKASLSARCAGEQGQYWAMHNAIFDARGQVTDQLVNSTLKQLKLNVQMFQKCLTDKTQLASIEKDIALATTLGVSGTPAFVVGQVKDNQLINYKRFDGVQSFQTFESVINGFSKN